MAKRKPWCPKQYTEYKIMNDSIDPDMATIVLVGLCNEEPLLQTLIGLIVFRTAENDMLEPQLINVQIGEDVGIPSNPYKPTFQWKKRGQYGIVFPIARGHGILLNLDAVAQKYVFITGINHGDSGSSGPISHGGPELTSVLDTILFGAENKT